MLVKGDAITSETRQDNEGNPKEPETNAKKRKTGDSPNYWERPFTRFLGRHLDTETEGFCKTWTEWLSLTKEFEHS